MRLQHHCTAAPPRRRAAVCPVQAGRLLDRAKYGVAYVSNVLLKLNLKLGGQNVHPSPMGCTLVQATPTIVLGADVYHAPPGTDRPSFAAVVASMDRHLATYHSIVTSQLSRCEVIESMEEMVTRQLRRFYELNGQLAPRRIFFYRDGVGVSQFPIIKQREVAAMEALEEHVEQHKSAVLRGAPTSARRRVRNERATSARRAHEGYEGW